MGCKLQGDVKHEYIKDDNNMPTNFKSGNRYVFTDIDHLRANPLPRFGFCKNWRCRIFHPGQPKEEKVCFKCFEKGHFKTTCPNDWACKVCRIQGHKEGQPECPNYREGQEKCFSLSRQCRLSFKLLQMQYKME